LFLVAVVLVVVVVRSALEIDRTQLPEPRPRPGPEALAQTTVELESESFYVNTVNSRNLFQLAAMTPQQGGLIGPLDVEAVRRRLGEIKNQFEVVGVAWLEPRIVMIHDRRSRQTFFLRESQPLGETGAEVRSITREKVTIILKDEEIDL